MFQGTIPSDARAIIAPLVMAWDCRDLAFPFAGNFTIPRTLSELSKTVRFHANDVSLYTNVLGHYFAHNEVSVAIKPDLGLEWMAPYMDTTRDRIASILVWSNYAKEWQKRDANPYYARIARGAKDQFAVMHAKILAKLDGTALNLSTYVEGDYAPFLRALPEEAGIIAFPPTIANGYLAMWKQLETSFDWTRRSSRPTNSTSSCRSSRTGPTG